ncbi:hypothetical protein KMI_04g07900 [Encephalitozoon hellem]|uniref:Uncharacterized protein n=1 Tax=Encephalitozoon hellem TaxID=27973 RepID=A0A9Q9C7W4_ENCHE|nr:uncharacterized protein EHEL_041575 [Encephalitozoon hellem ATCC 50504]AHL28925.1 hypothetical protein EHEL_041575 [Encephalitozoon hellem ATCC 50504]KAG5859979.1 hypothetical protein KMI_04g07900 [Encephalitozoon hellem]UTX43055.1 hypothetical protein GPU96_04g07900 [Encephalitozoon hellem]WEL38512.1 hypothetical protein PFJ87_04g01880 [Encephalitozoon hellem]
MEMKHSVAENALQRLNKEKRAYEDELVTLRGKLAAMDEDSDKYKRKLIEDQIRETSKALEVVEKQVLKFSDSQGEK